MIKDFFKNHVVDWTTHESPSNPAIIQSVDSSIGSNVAWEKVIPQTELVKKLYEISMVPITSLSKVLKSISQLESVITDPSQCAKAAIAVSQPGGSITAKSIQDSLKVHGAALNDEVAKFQSEYNFTCKLKIEDVAEQIAQMTSQKSEVMAELAAIQLKVDQFTQQILKLNLEKTTNAQELTTAYQAFTIAVDETTKKLNMQSVIILQHVK